ncbi:MAG: hypothetical protein ABI439_13870 [Rhodospirillales bacterium]
MRALKALVLIMGVIIVVGIAVIGVTIFNRLSKPTASPLIATAPADPSLNNPAATLPIGGPLGNPLGASPGTPLGTPLGTALGTPMPPQFDRTFGDVAVAIPAGARVSDFSASGDRLVLRVVMPDQEQRLIVVDLQSGALLGTIKLAIGGAAAGGGNPPILSPLPSVTVPPRNKNEGLK